MLLNKLGRKTEEVFPFVTASLLPSDHEFPGFDYLGVIRGLHVQPHTNHWCRAGTLVQVRLGNCVASFISNAAGCL